MIKVFEIPYQMRHTCVDWMSGGKSEMAKVANASSEDTEFDPVQLLAEVEKAIDLHKPIGISLRNLTVLKDWVEARVPEMSPSI